MRKIAFFILLFIVISRPASAAEIKPKQIVMENGLTVLFIERHSLPIINVMALIKAGSAQDLPDRSGLASFTASLLDEGTGKRTATQISEEVDLLGASLSAGADLDYTSVSLQVLKKDVEKGFDLFSDILLNPLFDTKEIERVRRMILGSILSEKDEPMAIAGRAFDNIVFGSHPYRNPIIGLEETVPQIGRDDMVLFYQTHYRPNNTLFSIVGDLTEKEAIALVNKYFSTWEKKPLLETQISAPILQPKKVDLIQKGLTQTSVLMGHMGIDRKNPDFYAVNVMNYILGGGGFSSRLLSEIRDNQGLVYSVHSSFDAHRQPGAFSIALQTKASNTNAAILGVLNEIRRIQNEGVSPIELDEAKAYLIGSFPLRLETAGKLTSLLSRVGFYNLELSYFTDYPKYIEKVTREDILRVAKTYLHPEALTLVVVGDLAEAKVSPLP